MKPSILKTAFQPPPPQWGPFLYASPTLFPLCLSHLRSSPAKHYTCSYPHLYICTAEPLLTLFCLKPLLPHLFASISRPPFKTQMKNPLPSVSLPPLLSLHRPPSALLSASLLWPCSLHWVRAFPTTFQVRLGAICGLDPSLTHL